MTQCPQCDVNEYRAAQFSWYCGSSLLEQVSSSSLLGEGLASAGEGEDNLLARRLLIGIFDIA